MGRQSGGRLSTEVTCGASFTFAIETAFAQDRAHSLTLCHLLDQSVSVCEFLCAQMVCCACVHVCKHCVSATATGYRNSILALRASALRCRNAVASTCNGCGLGCSRNTLATCSCSASSITWCHRAQHAVTVHLVESIACQRHACAVPTHRCSLHANCLFLQHATLSRPDKLIVFTVRLGPASCA